MSKDYILWNFFYVVLIRPRTNLKFHYHTLWANTYYFYEISFKSFCSWLMSKEYILWNFFYAVLIPPRTNLKFHSCVLIPFELTLIIFMKFHLRLFALDLWAKTTFYEISSMLFSCLREQTWNLIRVCSYPLS